MIEIKETGKKKKKNQDEPSILVSQLMKNDQNKARLLELIEKNELLDLREKLLAKTQVEAFFKDYLGVIELGVLSAVVSVLIATLIEALVFNIDTGNEDQAYTVQFINGLIVVVNLFFFMGVVPLLRVKHDRYVKAAKADIAKTQADIVDIYDLLETPEDISAQELYLAAVDRLKLDKQAELDLQAEIAETKRLQEFDLEIQKKHTSK